MKPKGAWRGITLFVFLSVSPGALADGPEEAGPAQEELHEQYKDAVSALERTSEAATNHQDNFQERVPSSFLLHHAKPHEAPSREHQSELWRQAVGRRDTGLWPSRNLVTPTRPKAQEIQPTGSLADEQRFQAKVLGAAMAIGFLALWSAVRRRRDARVPYPRA